MSHTGIAMSSSRQLLRRGGPLVAAVLVGAVVLTSCAGGENRSGDDGNPSGQGSEETMGTNDETEDEAAGAGEGRPGLS